VPEFRLPARYVARNKEIGAFMLPIYAMLLAPAAALSWTWLAAWNLESIQRGVARSAFWTASYALFRRIHRPLLSDPTSGSALV
jgi:hypothetical protein